MVIFMRISETLCYIKVNGNLDALEQALEQINRHEGSCITWYRINNATHKAEITISGYRSGLARELKKLGISREEIELC